MLSIIITTQKIYAGCSSPDLKRLSFGDKSYISLDQKPTVAVLNAHLDAIQNAYREATRTTGSKEPIPTSVAYPLLPKPIEGTLATLQDVKKFFAQASASNFSLIYAEPLHMAFLREIEATQGAGKKTVVLEALGDFVNLCYCKVPSNKVNGRTHETDSVKHFTYTNLGSLPAVNQLVETVAAQFSSAGLKVESSDKGDLARQIAKGSIGKHSQDRVYSITKKNNGVKIQAELTITQEQYDKSAAAHVSELKKELEKKTLDSLGIDQILLVGDFFKNKVVQNFLSKDLQLGNRIKPFPSSEIEKIMKGLSRESISLQKAKEEEVKKRKATEARQKALAEAKTLQLSREKLIADIGTTCTDSKAVEAYEKKFIPQGEKCNVPAEVVKWNIQEALKRVELQIPAPVMPAVSTQVVSPQIKKVAGSKKESGMKTMKELFRSEGVLHDPEFKSKKVFFGSDEKPQTLKLLEASLLPDPRQQERFMKVYQKELAYYQELSEMGQIAEGKYYTRTFIPRDTLKNYIKKTGLGTKIKFEKLNSKEIKFVVELLDEVKNLPVSHADLTEHNILVIKEKKWRNPGLQIRLIGFTSEDCSKKDMENRVHDIFERNMQPGVYAALRKNLNL